MVDTRQVQDSETKQKRVDEHRMLDKVMKKVRQHLK